MNKIKSLFLAVALILGVGAAYAFNVDNEPECFNNTLPYYSQQIAQPEFLITSTYSPDPEGGVTTFRCVPEPVVCHYAYDAVQDRWYTCTGEFTQNVNP